MPLKAGPFTAGVFIAGALMAGRGAGLLVRAGGDDFVGNFCLSRPDGPAEDGRGGDFFFTANIRL